MACGSRRGNPVVGGLSFGAGVVGKGSIIEREKEEEEEEKDGGKKRFSLEQEENLLARQ